MSRRGWSHETPTISTNKGDISLGYYWSDRQYNVYHWLSPDQTTIGYYFNIVDAVMISDSGISWTDLVVDYWIGVDGETGFLDMDELPANVDLDVERKINITMEHLSLYGVSIAREVAQRSKEILDNLVIGPTIEAVRWKS
ncbi:MAG: DUF402 domain-containing protein [Chloroflexi bacterium]|nr:DUF402 domain-containing protein [Chloroflexota bacterium]